LEVDGGSVHVRSLDQRGNLYHNDGSITIDVGTYTLPGSRLEISGLVSEDTAELIFTNGATTSPISDLDVAQFGGAGTIVVENGSYISCSGDATFGELSSATGTAVVRGAGSSLTVGRSLVLGGTGDGRLNVEDGGKVENRSAFIAGQGQSGFGSAVVTGAGSSWVTTTVDVADRGSVQLLDGGQITSTSASVGGNAVNGLCYVVVSGAGSKWTIAQTLLIGAGSGIATCVVDEGGEIEAAGGATIGASGRVSGRGIVDCDLLNNGLVSPGQDFGAAGTLTVDAAYSQSPAGALEINLSSMSSFDRLAVTGLASLAGTLRVSLAGAYTPAAGSSFDILTAGGGVSNDFSNYILPALPVGLVWNREVGAGYVRLSVATPYSADLNTDGFVDGDDLAVWSAAFGAGSQGDADFDGDTDGMDFLTWQRQVGSGGASTGALASLPEPKTAFLVALSASLVRRHRRRTSSPPRGGQNHKMSRRRRDWRSLRIDGRRPKSAPFPRNSPGFIMGSHKSAKIVDNGPADSYARL
jgi:T5SS/PEP-CTERM-associated repeat protein